MSGFVIVVDMQHDFVMPEGALPVPGAEAIVAPLQAWLAGLDPGGTGGILMTFDTHDPAAYAASPEGQEFPIHCVRGSPGWESVIDHRTVDPAIPLYRLEKGVFDMWAEPDVAIRDARAPDRPAMPRDAFFGELGQRGTGSVTVVGVAADYCVRWAMGGLVARGFGVELPAAFTRGIHRQAAQVVEEDFLSGQVELVAEA